jgi:hypothetical protein
MVAVLAFPLQVNTDALGPVFGFVLTAGPLVGLISGMKSWAVE